MKSRQGPDWDLAWRATRLAFQFLTVLPFKATDAPASPRELAAMRLAFPVVGFAIGVLLAGLSSSLSRAGTPAEVSAFLLVAAGVVLNGGLHLDGLADTADGLFLSGGPQRRLSVMRDPHVGSFGVSAIVLVLVGKYAALSALAGPARIHAVLGAAWISRILILVAAGPSRYARPEGTGRFVVNSTTQNDALFGSLAILAISSSLSGLPGLIAGVAVVFLAWLLSRGATRRLGGITGDILGALVELGELSYLLLLS